MYKSELEQSISNSKSKVFSWARAACAVLLTSIRGVHISGITGKFWKWLMAGQKNIHSVISRREGTCWAGSGSPGCAFQIPFIAISGCKHCRVRTSRTLWNILNCWCVIHTASGSSSPRIKDLKKWRQEDWFFFFKTTRKEKKKNENSKIYANPLGVLWKSLWWRIEIALKETLLKQKVSVVPRDLGWLGHLSAAFLTWNFLFLANSATKLPNTALQKSSPSEEEVFT